MTKDRFSNSNEDARRGAVECERAGEMVAYLYDEAGAEERQRFELHMGSCAACREELSAFRGVRRSVGEWRAEVLSAMPSVAFSAPAARAFDEGVADGSIVKTARGRSALAAFREFFALSPLWLRAAGATAALVICGLAGLTLARAEVSLGADGLAFRMGVPERVVVRQVEVPVQNGYTQAQVDEIADQRVKQALEEYQAKAESERESDIVSVSGNKGVNVQADSSSTGAARAKQRRRASPAPRSNAPGLVEFDDDLPRLSDILSVAN